MAGWLPLLLCLFFSLGVSTWRQLALAGAASSSKIVTSLPGFPGRLPFHLETGYVEVDEDNGPPSCFTTSWSPRPAVRIPLSFSGSPAATTARYSAASPWRSVHSNSSQSLTMALCLAWKSILTHGRRWQISYLWIHRLGQGFPFLGNPKDTMWGKYLPHCSSIHELLLQWFIDHPKFLASPLYIAGDSYAGKIVPFIAQKISEGIEAGRSPILNLKGYLAGNPQTGENIDISSMVPYAHGFGIISDQLYETISGHCQGEDYNSPTDALCAQALGSFNSLLSEVMSAQILLDTCAYASSGPRTATEKSDGDARKILSEEAGILMGKQVNNPPPRVPPGCISYTAYLSYYWANNELTREALGIKKGTVDEWLRCQSGNMPFTRDIKSSIKYHRNVTANGYRALIYSGDHDAIVPHLGTQAWVRSLGFPIVDGWRAWHLHGQSAGFTISYSNNMIFATVKGAGHTAPQYEPERCFAMFSRWILYHPL